MDKLVLDLIPSEEDQRRNADPPKHLACSLFPSIHFIPSYPQYTHSLCGFHALFNAITYVKSYFSSKSPQTALTSGWKFWQTYHRLLSFLKADADLSESAISTLENGGSLERYQLQFLLAHYPSIQSLGNKVYWSPVYFGFDNFQMSDEELDRIEAAIGKFVRKEGYAAIVLLLGVTNHWSVLVWVRDGQGDGVKEVYLDSKNMGEVLSVGEEGLDGVVEKGNRERKEKGIAPMSDYMVEMRKQHIRDLQSLLRILHFVLYSHSSFSSFSLSHEISYLYNSFRSHLPPTPFSTEALTKAVRTWLVEDVEPPGLLGEVLRRARNTAIRQETKDMVREWAGEIGPILGQNLTKDCENEAEKGRVEAFQSTFPALLLLATQSD